MKKIFSILTASLLWISMAALLAGCGAEGSGPAQAPEDTSAPPEPTFLEDLAARALPPLIPEGMTAGQWPAYRAQLIELFSCEVYGFTPPPPKELRARALAKPEKTDWAGKADESHIKLSFDTPRGSFSFPVSVALPRGRENVPLVIAITFLPYPDGYFLPVEEILDAGFGIAAFCYRDITWDDIIPLDYILPFRSLAWRYPRRGDSAWGKIGMWAFAASRVMDYAQTLDRVDKDRVFVTGHSRLGKTALWCAAQDERFAGVGVNNSGCGGAAIERGKRGERVANLTSKSRYYYWFCKNYQKYSDRAEEMPFDMHMLAALIAPRKLAVCSAEDDSWADPRSEFLCVYAASEAWDLLGAAGLGAPAEYPTAGAQFAEGRVGYSLRTGTHFFSRDDWLFYLRFFG